jgi:diguanylate cyclase (GGDEF)-like protein
LISIRKEMDESQQLADRFSALLQAFLDLGATIPKTALPADPELFAQCAQKIEQAAATLKSRASLAAIQGARELSLHQIDQICAANQAAFDERDAAVKDVVAMVAKAIGGIKCDGERQNSTLASLADGFEALSRVEDVHELRRRLKDDVHALRKTVEDMRRDNEDTVRRFEADVSAFEQRLETARKDSGTDRLTGLGGRRAAEACLQKIAASGRPVSLLLFDIEGFRKINEDQGSLFGDKLLQALTHMLRVKFGEEAGVFRWAADEFLVILDGQASVAAVQCRTICSAFASNTYFVVKCGSKVALRAQVAFGVHPYARGETIGQSYGRAREALEQSREAVRA